jgi:hypothetical protein
MALVSQIFLAVLLMRQGGTIQLHDYQPSYDCGGGGSVNMWVAWAAPGQYHVDVKKNGFTIYRGSTSGDINLGNIGVSVKNGDVFSIWRADYQVDTIQLATTTAIVLPGDPDHCN